MSLCLEPASPLVEAHCERLDTFAVLDPARWNELAGNVPFRQWEWVETWWRHYRQNRHELFLLVVHDALGDVIGIAPWYLESSPLGGRTVRFLGSGEVCSDFVSILCRQEHTASVAHALADWLTTRGRLTWDLLDLDGIDDHDESTTALFELLEFAGFSVDWRTELNTWRLELPPTHDAWIKQLSKNRREKVRQMVRRTFDTGLAASRIARTNEEVSEAWEALRRLHGMRRRSLGQSGCFASPRFESFHEEAIWRFQALGQLRLHLVTLDGVAAAAEYSLTGGDTVYMYQSGFDPERADLRPGWLNTLGSIRQAIDEGYRGYDFLRGDEPYKGQWRARPRTLWHVRVVANRFAPRLRDRTWHAGRAVRQWVRQQRQQLQDWWTAENQPPHLVRPSGDAT